jgi:hypothetical protein
MPGGRETEPKYFIRTLKANRISNTITSSLLGNIKLSFLIFGPGIGSKDFDSHRKPVKALIEKELHQNAIFPEDIDIESEQDSVDQVLGTNPATKELYLMKQFDHTIILMISIGSISEFSIYLTRREVAHKITLYIMKKHRHSKSYLMSGPVGAFKNVYKVYYFNSPEDLLLQVKERVNNLIVLRALQID